MCHINLKYNWAEHCQRHRVPKHNEQVSIALHNRRPRQHKQLLIAMTTFETFINSQQQKQELQPHCLHENVSCFRSEGQEHWNRLIYS